MVFVNDYRLAVEIIQIHLILLSFVIQREWHYDIIENEGVKRDDIE
jgi:hypothetical protein